MNHAKVFAFAILLLLLGFLASPARCQVPGDSALQVPVLPSPVEQAVSLPQGNGLEIPSLPDPVFSEPPIPQGVDLTIPDLPPSGQESWLSPERLGGGINWFLPDDRIGSDQTRYMLNLFPFGNMAYQRREGFRKIYFESKGAIYGMALADSGRDKTRLVVIAGDTLWYGGPSAGWELTSLDSVLGEGSQLISTPVGVIVTNVDDTARIWSGEDTSAAGVEPLGICDTGTVSESPTVAGDTAWIIDSGRHWLADYWIGYFVQYPSISDSFFAIIDNGPESLLVIGEPGADRSGVAFQIQARPDSVFSADTGLGFPRGPAAAYYDQRLFIASVYTPYRVWYSHQGLINDIDIDALIDLSMDADDRIMAMVLFNNRLLFFGSHSLFGMGPDLVAYPISKSIGCPAPRTIASGDRNLYFLTNRRTVAKIGPNIYGSLSYEPDKISREIDPLLQKIAPSDLTDCAAVYTDQQYWLSFAPDSCVVYDEETGGWYPQSFGFNQALVMPPLMGDLWSEELVPNGDVGTPDWSKYPNTANWYDKIDDKGTSDYIFASYNGYKARFDLSNLIRFSEGAAVSGLRIYALVKKDIAGFHPDIKVYIYKGTTDYLLGTISGYNMSTWWNTLSILAATNPVVDGEWTEAALDSLVLTLECVPHATDGYVNTYVAGLWVEPEYGSEFEVGSFLFAGQSKDFIYKYGGSFDDDTSSASGEVYGKPVPVVYRSGWFSGGSPIGDYRGNRFFLEKMADGEATAYLYKDFDSIPTETLTVTASAGTTFVEWLANDLQGQHFSVGIESSADTCQIKGWGLLLETIGEK